MNKKQKYIATGALAAFLAIGGTAAFFTSSDLITNVFKTGTTNGSTDVNAGIDVNEDFSGPQWGVDENGNLVSTDTQFDSNDNGYGEVKSGPEQVLPGDVFKKQVRVSSTADYNQFVRAKVVVTINIPDGTTTDGTTLATPELAAKYVKVTYNKTAATGKDGEWLSTPTTSEGVSSDDWFYYSKVLGKKTAHTADLIKSVELTTDAPNWMKNVTFNVEVQAESIQATPTAWTAIDGGWGQTEGTEPTAVDND